MAGHNKWSKIKRKKAINDARRSKIITKILREISVAAREGSPDPDANPRLRLAIQNAKKNNVPKELIQRAIHKQNETKNLKEVTYEGYAPGGVAVLVECMTDNINRTVSQVRAVFSRAGGNLGSSGSVKYLFERKTLFTLKPEGVDEEQLLLELIDEGVEDIDHQGDAIVITAPFETYGAVNQKLHALGIEPEESEIVWIPTTTVALPLEQAQKVLKMIEKLEELDDVQKVFHNLELTQELETALTNQ